MWVAGPNVALAASPDSSWFTQRSKASTEQRTRAAEISFMPPESVPEPNCSRHPMPYSSARCARLALFSRPFEHPMQEPVDKRPVPVLTLM